LTDAHESTYLDARSLVTFSGDSYCDNRERVFIFAYDTKEFNFATIGNVFFIFAYDTK
jgi:hypothetical protein